MSAFVHDVVCVECGTHLGPEKSVYKHALGCLNLKAEGVKNLLQKFRSGTDEYSTRVVTMLQYAQDRGE